MITRQYHGWLVDNDLIKRGDHTRIADICNEKKLLGINGGAVDRTYIQKVIVDGMEATAEIVEVIMDYYQSRQNMILKQKEIINA